MCNFVIAYGNYSWLNYEIKRFQFDEHYDQNYTKDNFK